LDKSSPTDSQQRNQTPDGSSDKNFAISLSLKLKKVKSSSNFKTYS
jgi:hypothetical protein